MNSSIHVLLSAETMASVAALSALPGEGEVSCHRPSVFLRVVVVLLVVMVIEVALPGERFETSAFYRGV